MTTTPLDRRLRRAKQPDRTLDASSRAAWPPRPHDRTEWLLKDAQEGRPVDRATAETLVLLNLGLADGIAGRYLGRGIDRDDLVQVALLELDKAVRRLRPGRGQSFAGFAAPTISGELKRHFRDTGGMVRPPRRLQELGVRMRDAEKDLEQNLRRRPRSDELAAVLDVDEEQVRAAREAASSFHALCLDLPAAPGQAPTEMTLEEADDPFAAIDDSAWLRDALAELTDRERLVLRLRFVDLMTQSDIADHIGVSQMQVSRILRATLSRLRARLEAALGSAA